MALDVSLGNIAQEEAARICGAVPALDDYGHQPGSTEPWVSQLVASFIVARGARTVLETGCFVGGTSVWIVDALIRLGGGEAHLCDVDPTRVKATAGRVYAAAQGRHELTVNVHCRDILVWLRDTSDRFDLAFVDDNHEKKHVEQELTLLYPLMNPGGLILLHDVVGSCDLRTVVAKFGGYSLDLPRLGPAGGLGIIQVPT